MSGNFTLLIQSMYYKIFIYSGHRKLGTRFQPSANFQLWPWQQISGPAHPINFNFQIKKLHQNIKQHSLDQHWYQKSNQSSHKCWRWVLVGLLRNPLQTKRLFWRLAEIRYLTFDYHCGWSFCSTYWKSIG